MGRSTKYGYRIRTFEAKSRRVQNRFESLKLKTRRHAALVRLMFDFLSPLSETEPRVASCHCTVLTLEPRTVSRCVDVSFGGL